MRRNSTVAGAHARSQVTTSLINRPNLLRIAHDTHLLHTRGLIHLINSRSEELRPYTYQPGFQCPPDPAPQSLSTPPYPTDYALTNTFHLLSEGGRILRPEGYVPLVSLGRSRPSSDEEDALTYLCASDHHSGCVLLLHYDDVVKHCPDLNTFPIETRNIHFL